MKVITIFGTGNRRDIVSLPPDHRSKPWGDAFLASILVIRGEVWPSRQSSAFTLPGGYVPEVTNACTCIDYLPAPMMPIALCFTTFLDGKNIEMNERTMAVLGVICEIAGHFSYTMELRAPWVGRD